MQNGHVICYESRKLKEHEEKYVTHDLELVSIVHALNMWRHYLMESKFELRTYHSGLKYLFEKQNLNARQSRQMEFLCEFDFDIKHSKGKENNVVDALNRRVQSMHASSISLFKSDLNPEFSKLSYQMNITFR